MHIETKMRFIDGWAITLSRHLTIAIVFKYLSISPYLNSCSSTLLFVSRLIFVEIN